MYFATFLFIQALITLLFEVYKTISMKYNLEHYITTFSSIAHGFLNILTADMINDLKEAPSEIKALGPNNTSSNFSLSTITGNPLDQKSINSDYPSLLHYTKFTSKSDTYPLNSTPLDKTETETAVKIYSETNYSFPPSFQHR